MMICAKHRTLFFAVPRTASKAISRAMTQHLGAIERKPMHMSYVEFMAGATAEQRKYFSFATVRNPLDSVVSAYFKKKMDHNGRFSRGTFKSGRPIAAKALEEYRFIVEHDADFATYFAKFYQADYSVPRHEETLRKVDHVLRYENLAEDYAALIQERGWPAHEVPVFNRTAGKKGSFVDYYPKEIHAQATRVFSRIMEAWGYEFPW